MNDRQLLIRTQQFRPDHYSQWLTLLAIVMLVTLGILVPAVAFAQSPVSPIEAMQRANQNYETGKFSDAAEIYQTMIDAGIEDSALYYNLGNTYYKQGDLGRAILNYQRALALNPRDTEAYTNLNIVRQLTLDQLDTAAADPWSNIVQFAEEWLTLREAAILALVLWWVVSFFIIMAILSRRLRRYSLWAAGILGFFLLIGFLSIANRYYTQQTSPAAVIVASETDVTSGPGTSEQYVVEFNLHSGAEVQIIEQRPGWRHVALPGNNFQGWVPVEAVEQVIE